MSATTARRHRVSYLTTYRADIAAHARVKADPNLSAEGRARALAPIAARLVPAHAATDRALADQQATAEGEVVYYHEPNVLRRYGAEATTKATGAADLAALEDAKGLLSFARNRVLAKNHAAAHGIRLAVVRRADLTADERKTITDALDEPYRERAELAVADLIGIKTERLRHNLAGPFGDRDLTGKTGKDLTARLSAIHEAQTYVHPGTGQTVSLSDADTARLLEQAGVLRDIGQEAGAA